MSFGKNRALPGKVRLVHMRSRAARVYASQRIAEALDADGLEGMGGRFVPVRHRADFFPSPAGATAGAVGAAQLELPLTQGSRGTGHDGKKLCGGSTAGDFAIAIEPGTGLSTVTQADAATHSPASPARRFDPAALLPSKRGKAARLGSQFTPSGFVWGCVLGTAAAGAILLVVYLIAG